MDDASVAYRLLHHAADIADLGRISDVDTVVAQDPWRILLRIQERAVVQGLTPVMFWEYDVGALTSFWVLAKGTGGVQLDLMYDPEGRGRYGYRSAMALELSKRPVESWPPEIDPKAKIVYLLSKRLTKGDCPRAVPLAKQVLALGSEGTVLVEGLLAGAARRRALKSLGGRFPLPVSARWIVLRNRMTKRGIARIFTRTGVHVVVSTADVEEAEAVADAFRPILARVKVRCRSRWVWIDLLNVFLDTRRPTLVLLVGSSGWGLGDAIPLSGNVEADFQSISSAMARDAARRLLKKEVAR